jgi:hypothetical protein
MRFTAFLALSAFLVLACLASTSSAGTPPSQFAPASTLPLYPYQNPIGPQYITSAIVWALLVGLLLLFVLYIGVSCIMSVERPVRMSAVPLQLSKEY